MRRITCKYAKPGMILSLPVYDNYGKLMFYQNNELDDSSIQMMLAGGVTEILIDDELTDDVSVIPLIPPTIEGGLGGALNSLIMQSRSKSFIDVPSLENLKSLVIAAVDDLALRKVGVVNMAGVISLRDYNFLQPVSTATLAVAVGKKWGLDKSQLVDVMLSSLLKDIVCICLPYDAKSDWWIKENSLFKAREHPVIGYKLIKQTNILSERVADTVLQHHEYWNGTGFPRALKERQISELAQIVTLADTFAFLLAARPDRKKYRPHEAIEYVMAYSGDLFSPDLVELFVREVPCYSSGLKVEMNNGDVGFVTDPNLGFVSRPKVRLCWDRRGKFMREPKDLDLAEAKHQQVLITTVLEYD